MTPAEVEAAVRASLARTKAGALRRLAREFPPRLPAPPEALALSDEALMRMFDEALVTRNY